MANNINLNILGTSFSITADENKAYLNKVLAQYSAAVENTRNISGIKEPLNIAILTGFLLCDEVNKLKQQMEDESIEVQKVTMKILDKLEEACGELQPNENE